MKQRCGLNRGGLSHPRFIRNKRAFRTRDVSLSCASNLGERPVRLRHVMIIYTTVSKVEYYLPGHSMGSCIIGRLVRVATFTDV